MSNNTLGTALITGASSGIGAVYADRLAKRGYDLILVARDTARLEALAARLRGETGRHIEVLTADLADRGQLAAVEKKLAADASITLLVNNAGISLNGQTLENDAANLERLIAVNITAPTLLAREAGRAFVARKRGAIINLASVLGLAPEMSEATYAGSKSYMITISQKLAQDVKDSGVRVQAVLPGATRTEIWERSGKDVDAILPGRVMEVDELVDAALVGFDRGELITIPPLPEVAQWEKYEAARTAMMPNLSMKDAAPRYRN